MTEEQIAEAKTHPSLRSGPPKHDFSGPAFRAFDRDVLNPPVFKGFEEFKEDPGTAPLPEVPVDHPEIHVKQEPYDMGGTVEQRATLAWTMLHTMRAHGGIGLAINQLGMKGRVIVMATNIPLALFNPRIVDTDAECDRLGEGCLSFPGLSVKVERSKKLRVRYQDITGEVKSKTLEGLAARVLQHEIDHLDGVTFFERAHPIHRDKARNQWAKLKRKMK